MQDEQRDPKNSGSTIAVGVGTILVLTYFLCPIILIFPLLLIYPGSPPESLKKGVEVFFAPITFLAERVPAYKTLLQVEAEFVSEHLGK